MCVYIYIYVYTKEDVSFRSTLGKFGCLPQKSPSAIASLRVSGGIFRSNNKSLAVSFCSKTLAWLSWNPSLCILYEAELIFCPCCVLLKHHLPYQFDLTPCWASL